MQQGIKAPPAQRTPQIAVAAPARTFVEYDELYTGLVTHQAGFELANDPGDAYAGQLLLQT